MDGHNVCMVRKHFFLDQDQIDFLESLPGTASEHLRSAINEFRERHRSTSASQSKRGDNNE